MGSSDFLPPFRPHFVAFVWPYHLAPVVCSRIHQTLQLRARGIRAWLPRRQFLFSVEMTGPPRFLGDPHPYMPCSSTPAGSPRQALAAIRCCLPPIEQRRHPRLSQFRGSITRPAHSLSTLRSMGCPNATQDSLPAGGQPLPGGVLPHWVPLQSFRAASFPLLPIAQACPGALKCCVQVFWTIRMFDLDQGRLLKLVDNVCELRTLCAR